MTLGSLCQIRRLQAGHQPGLSPKSHIRTGAQSGPTPETRHGQHTGTRSPGINQMPSGTWRHQRNLSTPREEQRKEDTPGSFSTPGCSPGSSLLRLVYDNQERCQAVSESTLFCPPLNAAAQSTPKEACASPRPRAGGLTLSDLRSPCICPATHKPAFFFSLAERQRMPILLKDAFRGAKSMRK